MQSFPYWPTSKQLGPRHMLLTHWKLLLYIGKTFCLTCYANKKFEFVFVTRFSASAKYVSLPDISDVCLTFTMPFYNGLHSIVRQMSDIPLPHFADTGFCYQLIAKPGNKTAAHLWPDPYVVISFIVYRDMLKVQIDGIYCDQAALRTPLSVCLSHLFDYVPVIVASWNFQELLPMTKVMSMQKVKVVGQRSRSQRS